MTYPDSFRMSTPSDREILFERDFHSPPAALFDAFTKPELVRQWLLGPDGWTMPVCEINLQPGGNYRYAWRRESTGHQMGLGGVFLEVLPPHQFTATEKFDDPWYPGEAVITTSFQQISSEITRLRLTVRYESPAARDIAAGHGMEQGIAVSYNRLENLLQRGGE